MYPYWGVTGIPWVNCSGWYSLFAIFLSFFPFFPLFFQYCNGFGVVAILGMLVINTIIFSYISCTATYIYSILLSSAPTAYFPWFFYFRHGHMTMGKSRDHINLQTYDLCFIPSTLHHHSNMTQIGVSHMPHNWGISIWQSASQLSVPEFYPPLISVGVAPPSIHLLCWESFVFLLLMTVKVRASFNIQYYLISHLSLWCCNMTEVSVVAPLANLMLGMLHS